MGSTHLCPYHRVVRDGHFRTNSPADSGQYPNLRIVRDPATRLKGRLRETTGQNHSMDRKKGLWGINHQGYFNSRKASRF